MPPRLLPFEPTSGQMYRYAVPDEVGVDRAPQWTTDYNGRQRLIEGVEWKPNDEFKAVLEYEDYVHNSTSVGFSFKDLTNGRSYYMFLQDFNNLMKSGLMRESKVDGVWIFNKKGHRYGVKLVRAN